MILRDRPIEEHTAKCPRSSSTPWAPFLRLMVVDGKSLESNFVERVEISRLIPIFIQLITSSFLSSAPIITVAVNQPGSLSHLAVETAFDISAFSLSCSAASDGHLSSLAKTCYADCGRLGVHERGFSSPPARSNVLRDHGASRLIAWYNRQNEMLRIISAFK